MEVKQDTYDRLRIEEITPQRDRLYFGNLTFAEIEAIDKEVRDGKIWIFFKLTPNSFFMQKNNITPKDEQRMGNGIFFGCYDDELILADENPLFNAWFFPKDFKHRLTRLSQSEWIRNYTMKLENERKINKGLLTDIARLNATIKLLSQGREINKELLEAIDKLMTDKINMLIIRLKEKVI